MSNWLENVEPYSIVHEYRCSCLHIHYVTVYCFAADFVAKNVTVNITIPTQSDPVPLKSVFGWIMIHQRLGYTFNWDLTWAEYKAGFGSIDADFWLGLENMHLLTTSQPYRLRCRIEQQTSGTQPSTGRSRSVMSSTTNIAWKWLDTAETPATASSMKVTAVSTTTTV